MTGKRFFRFRMPDGTTETNTDTAYLKTLGMTDEFIARRQRQEEAHLTSEVRHERAWRNNELLLTDRLMMPDATYNGVAVLSSLSSGMMASIMAYRSALRQYDLKSQPRPDRPVWFNG